MDIKEFSHSDWSAYAGGGAWFPLGFSFWATFFTQLPFGQDIDFFVTQSIMIWDGSIANCYVRDTERNIFGKKIADRIANDPSYVDFLCSKFREGADTILAMYKKSEMTPVTLEEYINYQNFFLTEYYPYHVQVKVVVDYLSPDLLERYLPALQSSRVHAEPVFSQETVFTRRLAEVHAEKTGYSTEQVLACLNEEFISYWKGESVLPDKDTLDARYARCAVFFDTGHIQGVLVGTEAVEVQTLLSSHGSDKQVQGIVAHKGVVRGTVRVIFDPSRVVTFTQGDILVAPSTRPEYLPLMKMAAAFVTDGGGILSHAAIVARELEKPCVIGTKIATKIFKDGDLVEVDAEKGIVSKLS